LQDLGKLLQAVNSWRNLTAFHAGIGGRSDAELLGHVFLREMTGLAQILEEGGIDHGISLLCRLLKKPVLMGKNERKQHPCLHPVQMDAW
jgi:hypothetical protein